MNILDTIHLLAGVIFIIFHNRLGSFTAYFQEKYMGYKYSKNETKYAKIGFLIAGILFTAWALLDLLGIK